MNSAYARRHDPVSAFLPVGFFLSGWLLAIAAVVLLPLLAVAAAILRVLARPHRVPQDRRQRATVIEGDYEVVRSDR